LNEEKQNKKDSSTCRNLPQLAGTAICAYVVLGHDGGWWIHR